MRKTVTFLLILILMMIPAVIFAEKGKETEEEYDWEANLKKSLAVDTSGLKATDNMPLLAYTPTREVPPRPENPKDLSETESGHWWDIEYAGYKTVKEKMPPRPRDGSWGKFIILLQPGQHAYWTAYINGMNKIAEAYNLKTKIYNANWSIDQQVLQVDQAINDKPDLILLGPADQPGSVQMCKKIWQAGIPLITTNIATSDAGMKYVITHVGPEDWEMYRKSARIAADMVGKKGGYAVLQSIPGSACFYSRMWGPVCEFTEYAPEMKLLAADASSCQTEPAFQLTSNWLSQFGDELKVIVAPDAGPSITGALNALAQVGRNGEVILCCGGHCKVSLDALKVGDMHYLLEQSSEGDGACSMQAAMDWMNGKELRPWIAIRHNLITKENVNNYYPTQW